MFIRLVCVGLLAVSLSACGASRSKGKVAIFKHCVEGGDAVGMCRCMAELAAADLDDKTFQMLVAMSESGDDAPPDVASKMSKSAQSKFVAFAAKVGTTC